MKYKINELSKILGVTSTTLRRYENNKYIVPERGDSDYRWYTNNDISRVAQIRLFRKCGFSHQDIMSMLDNEEKYKDYVAEFRERKNLYLKENHYIQCGDVMTFIVNTLGEKVSLLVCMPVSSV
ncbi:MAG: MerR family transcriptional regulator [Firmicutes bacterium]|nr:MerR family transcriptional regulator [Bacillota bacterium]